MQLKFYITLRETTCATEVSHYPQGEHMCNSSSTLPSRRTRVQMKFPITLREMEYPITLRNNFQSDRSPDLLKYGDSLVMTMMMMIVGL